MQARRAGSRGARRRGHRGQVEGEFQIVPRGTIWVGAAFQNAKRSPLKASNWGISCRKYAQKHKKSLFESWYSAIKCAGGASANFTAGRQKMYTFSRLNIALRMQREPTGGNE